MRLESKSVQIVHSTLRTMLGDAVREEVITRNPAAIVRPPSVVRQETKALEPGGGQPVSTRFR